MRVPPSEAIVFMTLPSYVVQFEPEPGQKWNWKVNTEESLEAFCKVLRLNGIHSYRVSRCGGGAGGGGA